jgi:hypothetical protein
MNGTRYATIAAIGLMFSLAGCTLPGRPADPIPFGEEPPGRWEQIADFSFYDIPKENLKGQIEPAYWMYMVTMAGFHTERFGITVGTDDDARYTEDGGKTWTIAGHELSTRFGMEIVDEKVAWHCGNGGTRRSVDGGRTWTTVTRSPCPSMSFLDERTGWAASPNHLRATNDSAQTWTDLYPPLEEGRLIAAIALRTDQKGYVLDDGGHLYASAEGGGTWDTRSMDLPVGALMVPVTSASRAALRFVDDRHGVAVFSLKDQSVWFAVTADGGHTWQREEIVELRGRAMYYSIYLSRDGSLLTVTSDYNLGENVSLVFRYVEE